MGATESDFLDSLRNVSPFTSFRAGPSILYTVRYFSEVIFMLNHLAGRHRNTVSVVNLLPKTVTLTAP